MPIDRRAIKAAAREQIRTARPRPYVAGLLFVAAAGALTALSYLLLTTKLTPSAVDTYLKYVLAGRYEDAVNYIATLNPPTTEYLISKVLDLFRGVVAAGFSLFALNTLRRKDAALGNLLDGFGRIFPLLLLLAVKGLLLYLWTSLLVIPGIFAFYRYRLAVYLFLDNPQLNPFHCILLSGQMMRGKKWQLLLLDLSFLGWAILAFLPLSIGSAYGIPGLVLGALASGAILAWLLPYYELSCAGFFEAVKTPIVSIPPEE